MKALLAVIVLIILAGGGYYLYSQSMGATQMEVNVNPFGETNTPTNTQTNTNTNTNTSTSTNTGTTTTQVREITVTNSGMTFNPNTLSIKRGERVKITFRNTGGTHDLRIDGYNVGTNVIQAGQNESFEFTADKAGSFEYYCSVGNHREMGMKGTLTVTN